MSKTLNTKDYNALSLAQPTNFKSMLNTGALLWGTGCRIPHEEAARIVASTPYHFCFIDAVGSLLLWNHESVWCRYSNNGNDCLINMCT